MEQSLLNGNLMNWNYRLSRGSGTTMCLQKEKRKDKTFQVHLARRKSRQSAQKEKEEKSTKSRINSLP